MEVKQKLSDDTYMFVEEVSSFRRYVCKVSPVKQFETTLTPIIEHLEKLVLSADNAQGEKHLSEDLNFYPAGTINKVITTLGLVLVEPSSADSLLYVGTHLFLCAPNENTAGHDMIPLGQIDDIFGCIKEPMYSVCLEQDPCNLLNVGQLVYYNPNHPKTRCVYIHEEEYHQPTHMARRCRKYSYNSIQ